MIPNRPLLRRLGNAILTTDRAQRLRIGRSLTAAAFYAALLGVLFVETRFGLLDRGGARALAVYITIGPAVFYAALRSGLNQRLAEPAMTLAQMLFAISALMLAYVVCVPVRAALLQIVIQVMAFGMFALTPAEGRRLSAFTIVSFGVTMTAVAIERPDVFDPRLELIHFFVLTAVMLVVTSLASQFAHLRIRMRRQRAELGETLARLEALIRVDELTGLVNRHRMQEVLAEERARFERDPRPSCLCAIDLDHFKQINDRFGHAAGDEVLKRFATAARHSLRDVDVLARWGGEEFLLLLPQTDAAAAGPVLERLRQAVADSALWGDSPAWRVTFSAGVTLWLANEPPEPAIERADQAAYRAKAAGRDRWCVG